ncbi:glycosyltransferase [Luteimonas sp. A501]
MGHADPQVPQALHSHNASLVHAHFGTDAVDIWPSVRKSGVPMVVTLHGYDINVSREWWESGRGGLRHTRYPRRLLQMSGEPGVRFLAVSKAVQDRAIAYGIPGERISLSYIGVDTNYFRPATLPRKSPPRIVFIGRFVAKKAPQLLVRAFRKIRDAVEGAELIMIGDGPLLAQAKDEAASHQLPVKFTGTLPSEEVRAYLQDAAAFCLPSITTDSGDAEGLPISILEALACGVPVITSARGADEAVHHGKNGFVFKEGDTHQLSSYLLRMLKDDGLLESMKNYARETAVAEFDLAACAASLETHYEQHAAP